jgi:hypothetical protein
MADAQQTSQPALIAVREALVGEPPAFILESRFEMVWLLVASITIAQPAGTSETG